MKTRRFKVGDWVVVTQIVDPIGLKKDLPKYIGKTGIIKQDDKTSIPYFVEFKPKDGIWLKREEVRGAKEYIVSKILNEIDNL